MASVLQFVRDLIVKPWQGKPTPPPIVKEAPGGYALFMDEDERDVIYAKEWPHVGCPVDERTNSTTWLINGQRFAPARRQGNDWIFRRCAN